MSGSDEPKKDAPFSDGAPVANDIPNTKDDNTKVDEANEESFPASDPPSTGGGVTGPND